MVYDGALSSNTKLYRKITLKNNAYVPQGKPVEIRALEEIEMDPEFQAASGTDFYAHIVADSGMYQYDKIGNLVLDLHEGVKIAWTPYGKVREVRSESDSLITTFRYDGAGNRVEKKVTRKDSVDVTHVTHYVRDASGNVMGVYTDSLMTEQYVYGSSRVGLYKGGRQIGQQSLGEKNYELSNHLGNVLVVVTDNIGMSTSDSVWASVVSTGDYYPFGLEMEGRTWSDSTASTYRHGFNGKVKDEKDEWGNVAYDYGFRIYDPVIARFKSVDPLTQSYPWYTPYQFAGNKPIWAIDVDGLEEFIFQYRVENGKATQIGKIDNKHLIPNMDLDKIGTYIVKDKRTGTLFKPEELGQVQYQYFDANGNRLNIRRDYKGNFVEGENELMPEHADNFFGSIYIGPNNPTYVDETGDTKPDYRREPQDEGDAAALQHDKDYDEGQAAGASGALFKMRVKPADQKLSNASLIVQYKYLLSESDKVTGEEVTFKTYFRATAVKNFFNTIINTTKDKNFRKAAKAIGEGASAIKN